MSKQDIDFDAFFARQEAEAERQRPARVAAWRANVLPIFVEQWPAAVHALSVRSEWTPFPAAELRDAWKAEEVYDPQEWRKAVDPFIIAMEHRIKALRIDLCAPAFFRLGSRSPKDWWYNHPLVGRDRGCHQPVDGSDEDIAISFARSERVLEDSFDARDAEYEMLLVAREWVEGIEPHREFRCFMENRALVGISVYRAWDEEPKPEIVANPARWENAIREWFPRLADASHVHSVVFDVVVLDERVVLLELNPFAGSTYPAHFLGHDLDGSFRYLGDDLGSESVD